MAWANTSRRTWSDDVRSDTSRTVTDAIEAEAIEAATTIIRNGNVAVLSGAGVSTDSGIPDYRGTGAPVRKPMVLSEFVGSEAARRRYWAGATAGWRAFNAVDPNPGHFALASLEKHQYVRNIITQNVDRLHERAGSQQVVHLHGFVDRVICLQCQHWYDREIIERQLAELNPQTDLRSTQLRPDGDVAVIPTADFQIPTCRHCGGMLKPSVVFFGETVPQPIFASAERSVAQADALLIVGSSLAVNSGVRIVQRAKRRRIPIIVINRGPTRVDGIATVRIEGGTSDVLSSISTAIL